MRIWKPPRPDREALTVNSRVITFADRNKVSAGRSLRARPRPGPCSLAESRRGSQVKGGAIAPAHRASVGALEVRGAAFTRALPTPGDSRIREHAKPFAPTHRLSHSRSNNSRIRRRNHHRLALRSVGRCRQRRPARIAQNRAPSWGAALHNRHTAGAAVNAPSTDSAVSTDCLSAQVWHLHLGRGDFGPRAKS